MSKLLNPGGIIPSITVTDYGDSDGSKGGRGDDGVNKGHEVNPKDLKKSNVIDGGGNYLAKKDGTLAKGEGEGPRLNFRQIDLHDLLQPSDWETESESEEGGISEGSPGSKPPGVFEELEEFVEQFDPLHFGYVPLGHKVLSNYKQGLRREGELPPGSYLRKRNVPLEEGGELLIRTPKSILDSRAEPDDPLGIAKVGEILTSGDLTISQKYRLLGVEEPVFDPLGDEAPSCWAWLKYKLYNLYLAQWPIPPIIH